MKTYTVGPFQLHFVIFFNCVSHTVKKDGVVIERGFSLKSKAPYNLPLSLACGLTDRLEMHKKTNQEWNKDLEERLCTHTKRSSANSACK